MSSFARPYSVYVADDLENDVRYPFALASIHMTAFTLDLATSVMLISLLQLASTCRFVWR